MQYCIHVCIQYSPYVAPTQTPTCIDLTLAYGSVWIVETSVKEVYCVYISYNIVLYYTLDAEVHTTQELYPLTKGGNVAITANVTCVDTQHYCNNTKSKQTLQGVLL